MGRDYTPAQKAAHYKYMREKTTLRVVVSRERAEEIKAHAQPNVSAYINRLIDEDMGKG